MAEMVIGIFENRGNAEQAIQDLNDAGFPARDISLVMRDNHNPEEITGNNVGEGAAEGAVTGGVIGGLAGLLVGIGALAIPGIGAVLIGGPLAAALGLTGAAATTLSGAVTGAVAGGLVGALTRLGLPEEEARVYEDRIRQGGILVAVPTQVNNMDEAKRILSEYDANQIKTIADTGRRVRGSREYGGTYASDIDKNDDFED